MLKKKVNVFPLKKNFNDYLIDTQSIHTLYTIKAHYEHSQNRNLTFLKKINVDFIEWWCPRTDSNRGPIDYKSIALPAELQGHAQ